MKKTWQTIYGVCAFLFIALVGCTNIANTSSHENSSAGKDYSVNGVVSMLSSSGAAPAQYLSSSLAESARAAFPSKMPTSLSYVVTAHPQGNYYMTVNGSIEEQSDGSMSYSVTLTSAGTWTIEIWGYLPNDESGMPVFSGTSDYSTADENAPDIVLEPLFYDESITGSVSLEISLATKNYNVARIAYSIDSDETTDLIVSDNVALLSCEQKIGNRQLKVYFYDESGARLYFCRESLTVLANTVTDTWYGSSKHFTTDEDGTTRFVLTDSCVEKFISHSYYVNSSNGSDSNGGTIYAPLKNMQSAIDRIISTNDGEQFYIYYSEAITDDSTDAYSAENNYALVNIEPGDKQLTLEIIAINDGTKSKDYITGNGTGRIFYIGANADVMLSNGMVVSGGSATVDGCESGGGAYVADGGKLTLTSITNISGNSATLTGSEDVYVEAGGTLWLRQWNYVGNVYLEKGANFLCGSFIKDTTVITPSEYDFDTVWVTFCNGDTNQLLTDNNSISSLLERLYVVSQDDAIPLSLTVDGKISCTLESTNIAKFILALNNYEAYSVYNTPDNPLSVSISDESPDITVLNEAINASNGNVYIALNLYACTGLSAEDIVFTDNKYLAEITLPYTYQTWPTALSDSAFSGCSALTTFTFSKKPQWSYELYKIGDSAFKDCTSLTAFTIPANVTEIGEGAFAGCTALSELTFVKTDTAWVTEDGTKYLTETLTPALLTGDLSEEKLSISICTYYITEDGDDTGNGATLASLQKAIDNCIAQNDGATRYTIYYDFEMTDTSSEAYTVDTHYAFINIAPGNKKLHLEIIALNDGVEEKNYIHANGTGRVFFIGENADVTFGNGVVVASGSATTPSCDRGGGVYIARGGKLTLTSTDYFTDNTASLAGSEDVYVENGASLWLQSCGNAGNVYLEIGADFATHGGLENAFGSREYVCGATITPNTYGDDTVWVTYWENDDHETQNTGEYDWAVRRAIERVFVADCNGKTYSLTPSGTIVESGMYIALGGENIFNLTSVTIDGVEQSITHKTLAPSGWNAISEFETVLIPKNTSASVSFTFTQPMQGANAWNSWSLAFYDNVTRSIAKGQVLRADDYLNTSVDAGFSGGIWNDGNLSAYGTYSNGYTYRTAASQLPADATIVVTVDYDGENITVTETVNGVVAYSVSSNQWISKELDDVDTESLWVALGGENALSLSSVSIDGVAQTITHESLAPSAWYAISEFEIVQIQKGASVSFTFTQPMQGANAWNSWSLALYDNETVSVAKGQFVRGDNYLNLSTAAGFASGLWSSGNNYANGEWSNGYTYLTCASQLLTDAVVIVTVSFDGSDVTIVETVNGAEAYTTSSTKW